MARMAQIDGQGRVVNVIVAEPGFELAGFTLVESADAGIGWTFADGVFSPPADPARSQAELRAYAAARRWDKEHGGLTLPGGIRIKTDTEARVKVRELRDNVAAGALPTPFAFKAENGWVDLDQAAINGAYAAIVQHVAACFAAEREMHDGIEAGTVTTFAAIDAAFGAI